MIRKNTRLFKSAKHKHQHCLKSALASAKKHCHNSGLRLTPIRQHVLELIWQSHEPVKAYNLLDELKQITTSSAPPTVYRALDFLQAQGFVHKIESLNAYIGCGNPLIAHQGQFFICHHCGLAAELNDIDIRDLIRDKAAQYGFEIDHETIEIKGRCRSCCA